MSSSNCMGGDDGGLVASSSGGRQTDKAYQLARAQLMGLGIAGLPSERKEDVSSKGDPPSAVTRAEEGNFTEVPLPSEVQINRMLELDAGVAIGVLRCPVCDSDHHSVAIYMQHLRAKHHRPEEDLARYQVEGLKSSLLRCVECGHLCYGQLGLAAHRRACQKKRGGRAACPLNGGVPKDGVDMEVLLLAFRRPLDEVYRSWRPTMLRISRRLLKSILSRRHEVEDRASVAFLLLPGLVAECHRTRKVPAAHMLHGLASLVDTMDSDLAFANSILGEAWRLAPYVRAHRETVVQRTPEGMEGPGRTDRLVQRIETLVRGKKLGQAMRQLDYLQDITCGEGNRAETLSVRDFRSHLTDMSVAANERDCFSEEQKCCVEQSSAVHISEATMSETLRKLPLGSAAGVSGWTFSAITAIFLSDEAEVGAAVTQISAFSNALLGGKLAAPYWLFTRGVLIEKGDGSYRMLGIGESWLRLAERAAMKVVGPSVGGQLAPLQFGVGVSSGCEIAGRSGQLVQGAAPEENLVGISVDLKRAFDYLRLGLQLQGLIDFAPTLLRWFSWAYARPSPIFYEGEQVGMSATGVRQGDPLAPLCFSVAIQPLLLKILAAVQGVVRSKVHMSVHAGVYAYIDDINIFVDGRIAFQAAAVIKQAIEEESLELSGKKCVILAREGACLEDGLLVSPFRIERVGMKMMGTPAGTAAFRKEFARLKVEKATRSLPAMGRLKPWSVWQLVRYCVVARMGYLARVGELAYNLEAFRVFDQRVDEALRAAARISADDLDGEHKFDRLRALPLALNGLGIPRYAGLAGETACLLSRQVTYLFWETHNPALLHGTREDWPPIQQGALEDESTEGHQDIGPDGELMDVEAEVFPSQNGIPALFLASGETAFMEGASDGDELLEHRQMARGISRPTLLKLPQNARRNSRAIQSRRAEDFISELDALEQMAEAIFMRDSCFPGSGGWLGPGGHLYGAASFTSPEEYVAALRMRLLLSPASSDVGDTEGAVHCRCGKRVVIREDPYHPLHCPKSQWHWWQRHNAVRDHLIGFAQKHLGESGTAVIKEPIFGRAFLDPVIAEGPTIGEAGFAGAAGLEDHAQSLEGLRARTKDLHWHGKIRGDVGLFSTAGRQVADVYVVDTTAESYRTQPPRDKHDPDPAIFYYPVKAGTAYGLEHGVALKRRHYLPVFGRAALYDDKVFVPFVVAASGKLSVQATRLVDQIVEHCPALWARARFRTHVGAIIARWNAKMALDWVRSIIGRSTLT